MGFETLSRRQLQALCKKNKIPANITNVAMAHALNSLHFVEGIEEVLNSQVPESPMVPKTASVVAASETPSGSVILTYKRRKIEVSSKKSLDEVEDKRSDASVETPAAKRVVKNVYSTRRSARLAKKIEVIEIDSDTEESDGIVEVESSVDQNETSELTVPENFKDMLTFSEEIELRNNDESKANSEEKSGVQNEDVAVTSIEQIVASDIKADTGTSSNVDKEAKVSMEKNSEMNTDVDEEAQASTEKETEMQSNVGDKAMAFIEKDSGMSSNVEEETEMKSSVGEEAKAFIEKETGINFNVEEGSQMQSNVGEEAEAFIEKETGTNSNVEEETEIRSSVGEEAKAFIEKETGTMQEETEASVDEKTEMNVNVDEEIKASIEKDTEIYSNVDEGTKSSIEKDTEMNTNVDVETQTSTEKETEMQSAVGVEAKAFVEKETGMSSNSEETEASIKEKTEMNFNVSEESKASIEKDAIVDEEAKAVTKKDTEINFNVNEETESSIEKEAVVDEEATAFTEKDTEMNSNLDEEARDSFEVIEMNSNKDDETKSSIADDTTMNFKEDVEIIVAEFKVADSCNVTNDLQFNHDEHDKELEAYAEDRENDGDKESDTSDGDGLVDDKDNLESVTEFNQDEMTVSEYNFVPAEIQNGLLNSEAKHEHDFCATGSDPVHIDAPLIDDDVSIEQLKTSLSRTALTKAADKVPRTVKGLTQISGDKENVDSGRKLVLLKCGKPKKMPYEGYSIRKLEKMLQEKVKKFDSDDIVIPEVEIQNELLNSEAKHEYDSLATGSDPIHIDAPLINDNVYSIEQLKTSLSKTPLTKSADKVPRTVRGLTKISGDKENVDSGRKSVLLKCGKPNKMPYEGYSIRKLEKMLQEKVKKSVADDIVVPEVEINDDVSSVEPLKASLNKTPSTKSADKAGPGTTKGLTQISDKKENVDSGRKSILLKGEKPKKMPNEDCSLRKLEKMLQEKLKNMDNLDLVTGISQQKKEDIKEEDTGIKETITRPARRHSHQRNN